MKFDMRGIPLMPVIAVSTGLGMMKQEQGLVRTRVGSTSGRKSRATDVATAAGNAENDSQNG